MDDVAVGEAATGGSVAAGVDVGDVMVGDVTMDSSATAPVTGGTEPGHSVLAARRRSGFARRIIAVGRLLRRFTALLLIAGIVVSLGTVSGATPKSPAAPSPTERAGAAALQRAVALESSIGALMDRMNPAATGQDRTAYPQHGTASAGTAPAGTAPAGTARAGVGNSSADKPEGTLSGRLGSELRRTLSMLDAHRMLLTIPASDSAPPASAAAIAARSETRITPAAAVVQLAASGNMALADSMTVHPAMARLLASIGARQLLQARSVAVAADLPEPRLPDLGFPEPRLPDLGFPEPNSPAVSRPEPSCPAVGIPYDPNTIPAAGGHLSGAEPASDASTAGRAVRAALAALDSTIYAYQVSASRMGGAARSAALSMLGVHERSAAAGSRIARGLCLQDSVPQAGYRLDPAFTRTPATALAGLEEQLGHTFADVIALGGRTSREWAINNLLAAAHNQQRWGGRLAATPGITAAPAAAGAATAEPTKAGPGAAAPAPAGPATD